MLKIITLMLVVGFTLVSFCGPMANAIDIYTFKKDRVDQDLSAGNRGYLSGNPPKEEGKRNLKRTLIGVDIELAGTDSDDDDYEEAPKGEIKKQEEPKQTKKTIERVAPEASEKEPIKEGAAKRRKQEETEKDWIK